MLVYRYEFWDERRGMIRESDTFETLDAILQGLGIPLMHSGKVVPCCGVYRELVEAPVDSGAGFAMGPSPPSQRHGAD